MTADALKLELRASPPAIRKARGDVYIDLSALGEGYGADLVAATVVGERTTVVDGLATASMVLGE